MGQVVTLAELHQQMPADQIRHTRTMLEAIMPGHRAAWFKFGSSEEISDLLKRSAVLEGQTHQAGDDVVKADQFRGAVRTFEPEEDFGWVFVLMDAEVERPLSGNANFLCAVSTASGKRTARRRLSYIGHAVCNSL